MSQLHHVRSLAHVNILAACRDRDRVQDQDLAKRAVVPVVKSNKASNEAHSSNHAPKEIKVLTVGVRHMM